MVNCCYKLAQTNVPETINFQFLPALFLPLGSLYHNNSVSGTSDICRMAAPQKMEQKNCGSIIGKDKSFLFNE
jgi:hypothetical protein